jgi:hypothetical protein
VIPLSPRYLPPLLVLLVLAAIPVTIHRVGVMRFDDCRDPEALQATERIPGSQPDPNAPEWTAKALVQWSVGAIRIGPGGGPELRYRIVRSYDASDLYTYPLKFLDASFAVDPDRTEFAWREAQGERLPVYVATLHRRDWVQLAIYMFVAGSGPVASPLRMEIESALPQLLSGTRPSTLLMVSGVVSRQQRHEVEAAAVEWLASALGYYREVCLP